MPRLLRVAVALALALASAPARAATHACGDGPVVLSMTRPRECQQAGCTFEHSAVTPDAYRALCGTCKPGYGSWEAFLERWSDWPPPECAGSLIGIAGIPQPIDVALNDLQNVERAKAGLPPLLWSDALWQAAQEKAQEQVDHAGACPAHDMCSGEPWWQRIQRYYPNWLALGENSATTFADPQLTVNGWMGSTAHRGNILSPAYRDAGCALRGPIPGFVTWDEAVCDFGAKQ